MHLKLPEIRINFSGLLYDNVSRGLAKDINEKLPAVEDCHIWTANYRTEWAKYEQKILTTITESLGITFYKPVIDVSIAPFFTPQSDPLIISFAYYPDQFVDILTHELVHVLLTDNNKMSVYDEGPGLHLVEEWQTLFGKDHDFATLVHIPVFATLKYIYLDILKDKKRFERDLKDSNELQDPQPYIDAWKYVNDSDYKVIITQLKESYASIG